MEAEFSKKMTQRLAEYEEYIDGAVDGIRADRSEPLPGRNRPFRIPPGFEGAEPDGTADIRGNGRQDHTAVRRRSAV